MNQDIENKVIKIIADSLALNIDDIKVNSTLFIDLGLDSLDFLDIIFSLEKEFNIKLRDKEFENLLKIDASQAKEINSLFLTKDEIKRISEWIPQINSFPEQDKIKKMDLFAIMSVETLILLVKSNLTAS